MTTPRKPNKLRMKRGSVRPVGRPDSHQRVVTPEMTTRIARAWLEGRTARQIALLLDIAPSTVLYHIQHRVRPAWKVELAETLQDTLAKVRYMETVAWECFHRSEKPASREQIKRELVGGKGKNKDLLKLSEKMLTTIYRDGDTTWLVVVQWCHEFLARVAGWYAREPQADNREVAEIVPVVVRTREEAEAAMTLPKLFRLVRTNEQN